MRRYKMVGHPEKTPSIRVVSSTSLLGPSVSPPRRGVGTITLSLSSDAGSLPTNCDRPTTPLELPRADPVPHAVKGRVNTGKYGGETCRSGGVVDPQTRESKHVAFDWGEAMVEQRT